MFKYIYENAQGLTTYDKYFDYLSTIKEAIPYELYSFAADVDRYNLNSEKSLHDSWLRSLTVTEVSHGDKLSTNIEIVLLSAQQDKLFTLEYRDVIGYDIHKPLTKNIVRPNDLLCHEFRLQDDYVEHAIEFDNDVHFIIKFQTFSFLEN